MNVPFGNHGPHGGFVIPIPFPNMGHNRPAERAEQAPARVVVAMAVLQSLTSKTEIDVAVWESGSESYPGQKLTDEELNLQATACNLVSAYLAGTYKPTEAEQRAERADQPKDAMALGCMACGTHGSVQGVECRLCRGAGHILVTPLNPT